MEYFKHCPYDTLNKFLEMLNEFEDKWEQAYNDLVTIEGTIQDLLHEIELSEFDSQRGYELALQLKEARIRRRMLKDIREQYKYLFDWLKQHQNIKVSLFKVQTSIKQVRQMHEERIYQPRVLKDLQCANAELPGIVIIKKCEDDSSDSEGELCEQILN